MQIVGKSCGVCARRMSSELDARVCAACEVVFHGECAAELCPSCGRHLADRADLERERAEEHWDRLTAEWYAGRRILWICFFTYLAVSLLVAVPALLSRGDVLGFAGFVTRWIAALEATRRIARGSILAAKIAIGLLTLAGAMTWIEAIEKPTVDRVVVACLLGTTLWGVALRLSTSSKFWDYLHAQKRFYDGLAGEEERK